MGRTNLENTLSTIGTIGSIIGATENVKLAHEVQREVSQKLGLREKANLTLRKKSTWLTVASIGYLIFDKNYLEAFREFYPLIASMFGV